jgi:hypothetical protein
MSHFSLFAASTVFTRTIDCSMDTKRFQHKNTRIGRMSSLLDQQPNYFFLFFVFARSHLRACRRLLRSLLECCVCNSDLNISPKKRKARGKTEEVKLNFAASAL